VVALPYPEPKFGLFELPDLLIDCPQPVADQVYPKMFTLCPEIEAIFLLVSGTILVELGKVTDAAVLKSVFPDAIGGLDVIILPVGVLKIRSESIRSSDAWRKHSVQITEVSYELTYLVM
jgi:hypothetical protein